jgi:hypothetical protein
MLRRRFSFTTAALLMFLMQCIPSLNGQVPGQIPPEFQEMNSVLARTAAAYGARRGGPIVNSKASGTLTYFTVSGRQAIFNVTLLRKGNSQVQRIIHQPQSQVWQGSNGGESWSRVGGFTSPAQGAVLSFIESQTTRSIDSLFSHRAAGLVLHDAGALHTAKIIEAEDRDRKKTRYHIDVSTSLITKVEVVTGQETDMFGRTKLIADTYLFSDFRDVEGVVTPFKMERFMYGIKIEEMELTSVLYNTAVFDADFRPHP